MKITTPIHDTLPDGTAVTLLPFNSVEEAPERLVQTIQELLNLIIIDGTTYPQDKPLDRAGFLDYYFPNFVAVLVKGTVDSTSSWDIDSNPFMGCFYIKPNYPGRSAHICNAGFIVQPQFRGRKVGHTMGTHYLEWAPLLGYRYSVFNLVYASNIASVSIWDSLGFQRIGRVPNAGHMKGLGYVDAIQFGYDFTKGTDPANA